MEVSVCSEYSFTRDAKETRRVSGKKWFRHRRVKWFLCGAENKKTRKRQLVMKNTEVQLRQPAITAFSTD